MFNLFKKKPKAPLPQALNYFRKLKPTEQAQIDIVYDKFPIVEIFHSELIETLNLDIETKSGGLVIFIWFSADKPNNEEYFKNFNNSEIFSKFKRTYQLFPDKDTYYFTTPNKSEINLIERDIILILHEVYGIKNNDFFNVYLRSN